MVKMARFNEIVADFTNMADFLIVYIEEAHPTDGWFFRNNVDIQKHNSLEDRVAAAKRLGELKPCDCDIVADNMEDGANKQYGGLYERLYIVLNRVVLYEGMPGPIGYNVEEVYDWLAKYRGDQ